MLTPLSYLSSILTLSPTVLFAVSVVANPTNVSIDDTFDDQFSGLVPIYRGPPNDGWVQGPNAQGDARLDPVQTFRETWHDSTFHPGDAATKSIEVQVIGTAVYAYFITANANPIPITALTNLSFFLDDQFQSENFVHKPDPSTADFNYNVLGFSKTGLINTAHTLFMETATGHASLVLFDYVLYT